MRFLGSCFILFLLIGLATACGGSEPAVTTSTSAADHTVKCTVFATREGLVGRTTANGHVIQPTDRFVALPSRSVLAKADGNEFQVRVTYKNTTVTVPVWDVGPWNTEDNYWDSPEQRLRWKDLPQCLPQAQEAFVAKHNDGKDQSGRQVKNPAGIDLSDGTWAALGMTDNDKVVVEYLWTKGSAATGMGTSAPSQRPAAPAVPSAPTTATKQNPSTVPIPTRARTIALAAKECRTEAADRSINCDRQPNIYTANDDGSQPSRVAEAGTYPVWSPDGTKIAFVSTASGDPGSLYVVNKDGTNLTRLTKEATSDVFWRTADSSQDVTTGVFWWTADGSKIVFPFRDNSVYIITLADTTERKLGVEKGFFRVHGFTVVSTASGIKSAYWETTEGGGRQPRRDLLVDNLDGTNPTKITTSIYDLLRGSSSEIDFSPDGRHLVYAITEPSGESTFMVSDADGGNKRKLTPEIKSERFQTESSVFMPFTWSPTNDKVAYQTRDNTIYVQDITTGEEKKVGPGRTFAWSPDGSRIAFSGPNKQDISVFDISTSKTTTIGELPRTTSTVFHVISDVKARIIWSNDGKRLYLKNLEDLSLPDPTLKFNIRPVGGYIINADGTRRITLEKDLYFNSLLQLVGDIAWSPTN